MIVDSTTKKKEQCQGLNTILTRSLSTLKHDSTVTLVTVDGVDFHMLKLGGREVKAYFVELIRVRRNDAKLLP